MNAKVVAKIEYQKNANDLKRKVEHSRRELETPAVVGRLRINRPRPVSNETARSLRRNTVGESVRMKCGMVTQTEPGTILLCSLGYGCFFPGGKVFPRIEASDA